jgi:PAS domain S-box-containing protein
MSSTPSSQGPIGNRLQGKAANRAADARQATDIVERLPELAAGVAILGDDAAISSWNPQAMAMTGYTLEQVCQVGLSSIFEPEEVMRHILFKGCSGVPTPSEYLQLRHADGRMCPVVVQCAPQRQLHQNPWHVVLVFRTIDVHLENLRRDEHLMVMGRFASSLSHEIRNQLNAVMLHTDVLSDILDDVPSETRHLLAESVVDIRHEISRLHEVVENFLSLARVTRLDLVPVMLATFIEALNEEMAPVLASHGIRLHQCLSTDLGEVALHTNTFRHLWRNLIDNAIDAMPNGGELTIRAECSGDEVRVTITDTGTGIAADQMPLLFVPFHTTKPDGTGLGLYVVQEVAAAHHGRIDVSSEVSVGTSFTVILPIVRSDERAPEPESR